MPPAIFLTQDEKLPAALKPDEHSAEGRPLLQQVTRLIEKHPPEDAFALDLFFTIASAVTRTGPAKSRKARCSLFLRSRSRVERR